MSNELYRYSPAGRHRSHLFFPPPPPRRAMSRPRVRYCRQTMSCSTRPAGSSEKKASPTRSSSGRVALAPAAGMRNLPTRGSCGTATQAVMGEFCRVGPHTVSTTSDMHLLGLTTSAASSVGLVTSIIDSVERGAVDVDIEYAFATPRAAGARPNPRQHHNFVKVRTTAATRATQCVVESGGGRASGVKSAESQPQLRRRQ